MTKLEVEMDAHDLTLIHRLLNSYIVGLSMSIERAQRERLIIDYTLLSSNITAASALASRLAHAAIDAIKREQGESAVEQYIAAATGDMRGRLEAAMRAPNNPDPTDEGGIPS